jgi:hypothetical protein
MFNHSLMKMSTTLHKTKGLGNSIQSIVLQNVQTRSSGLQSCSVSFTGKFSPNFDLKNMITTYTKEFSQEKWPKFARFLNNFFPKLPESYDDFQKVAKNIEGFSFFSTFISIMQRNLAKLFSG